MAGLSTTLYDSGSIELIGTHSAAAISGATPGGRALSDVAHSSGGLRYFEVEVVQLVTGMIDVFLIGFVDSTSNLTSWIGLGSERGFIWRNEGRVISGVELASIVSSHGIGEGEVGSRQCFWFDPSSRKIWMTGTDREGGRYGDGRTARPDLGTTQTHTIPGTGAVRIALSPARGSGSNRNVLRLRSRHSELVVSQAEQLGALPWDARSVTINLVMRDESGAFIASGTEVEWAWFDQTTPDALLTPTSRGTATVGGSGALSINVTTSLDPGGTGWLLVSTSSGTAGEQCRSHAMPTIAP